MCLFVFGYSDKIETAQAAAPCIQDCDAYWNICNDQCQDECDPDSTDTACNSCLTSCSDEWNTCLSTAIYCGSGTVSYSPQCTVHFGIHCPFDSSTGTYNCNQSHNGYFEVCERIGYVSGCIVCPSNEECRSQETQGTPHCL